MMKNTTLSNVEAKKFSSVEQAVKELGSAEALACINHGHANRVYRKNYNIRREERLERLAALEADPAIAAKLQEILAKRSK